MLASMISSFSHYLREQQIPVPTSVVSEVIEVLPSLPFENKEHFYLTIRQLWIKDTEQYELFDECFQEFFYKQLFQKISEFNLAQNKKKVMDVKQKVISEINQREKATIRSSSEWLSTQIRSKDTPASPFFLKELNKELSKDFETTSNAIAFINDKEMEKLTEELIWEAILSEQESTVFDSINSIRENLITFKTAVNKIKKVELTELSGHVKTVHTGMRKMIRTEIDQLKDKPIRQLKPKEILALRDTLERSSLSLMTKFSKLLKGTNKEAEIDISRTVAASLSTHGVPMRLIHRKPKKKKTKIDVIMDVSGSVVKSAEFLTLFSYLLHKQFPNQVRIFSFVGLLAETTDFFQSDDIDQVVNNSLKNALIDYRAYSNYDMALDIYQNEHLGGVDKDTIVFVLGDARNNRNEANLPAFQQIREIAKHVVWFNPEEQKKWDNGDSVIGAYKPFCDFVFETTTFNQLIHGLEETVAHLESVNAR